MDLGFIPQEWIDEIKPKEKWYTLDGKEIIEGE
jgi:hypothetical protein